MRIVSEHAGFEIRPLPADVADRLRSIATVVQTADATPGFPCRQCLRDAEVGDEVVLVSFDPFDGWPAAEASPYRSASPIYLHRRDCSARLDPNPIPRQLAERRLSVRAFDAAAMMSGAELVDGGDLSATLTRLLADPAVHRVHVHNAGAGCFAASAGRS